MSVSNNNSEDSGLHDIKKLAEVAKRRAAQQAAPTDAAASMSLSAIALPEPARMEALPLPPVMMMPAPNVAAPAPTRVARGTESPEAIRTPNEGSPAKPALASGTQNRTLPEPELAQPRITTPVVVRTNLADNHPTSARPVPLAEAVTAPVRANRPTAVAGPARLPWVIGGSIVALAAGLGVYGWTGDSATPTPQATVVVAPKPVSAPAVAPVVVAEPEIVAEPTIAPVDVAAEVADEPTAKSDKPKGQRTMNAGVPEVAAPVVVAEAAPAKAAGGAGDGQQETVDDLLRNAGVTTETAKDEGPKLDKKQLTGADMKAAMNARRSKVNACYKKFGEAGNAAVRVQVAPTGKPVNVTVTGEFAGTPTGSCVVDAVSGAEFPAWDGAPTTVNFSYLLND